MDDALRLEVSFVHRIGGTVSYGHAIQAHASMIGLGQADPRDSLFDESHSAVVAKVTNGGDEYVVGIVTCLSVDDVASLGLVYVNPDYRRRGILHQMMSELVKAAERSGVHRVRANLPIGNVVGAKALVAVGMRVTFQTLEADVEGVPEGVSG